MTTESYDPGPKIAHAGGINIGTPDLEKSLWFFRDLLGMEVTGQQPGVAYLRGYQERVHHSLTLTSQAVGQVNTLGFRVGRPQDVELFHDRLSAGGTEVLELASGVELGRGTAIRFLVPGAQHPVELYYDIEKPEAPEHLRSNVHGNSSKRRGLGVQRIDHHNVSTSSETMTEAEGWLRSQLGLRRREYISAGTPDEQASVSWLSVNTKLHDIALGSSPDGAPGSFHHVAFALENYNDVLVAADAARDAGVQIDAGPGIHGVGQSMYLYLREPGSGQRFELYAGGYAIFDPDWEPLRWELPDIAKAVTWVGDLPVLDPETSNYLPSTRTAGLHIDRVSLGAASAAR